MPTSEPNCHKCGTRVLRQSRLPCTEKGLGARVLIDFSANSINRYYNLEPVNPEAYDRLHEHPNYPEVLRMLTNKHSE